MTYTTSRNDHFAPIAGMSTPDWEAAEERASEEFQFLTENGRPDLDVEERDEVSESDIETVSAQDRLDLEMILDRESCEGFYV